MSRQVVKPSGGEGKATAAAAEAVEAIGVDLLTAIASFTRFLSSLIRSRLLIVVPRIPKQVPMTEPKTDLKMNTFSYIIQFFKILYVIRKHSNKSIKVYHIGAERPLSGPKSASAETGKKLAKAKE